MRNKGVSRLLCGVALNKLFIFGSIKKAIFPIKYGFGGKLNEEECIKNSQLYVRFDFKKSCKS